MPSAQRTITDLCGTWAFTPEGGAPGTIPVPAQWTHGASLGLPEAWRDLRRAVYARDLILPAYRPGRLLRLRFGAVMLLAQVRLAGLELGQHRGGFTPFTVVVPDSLWQRQGSGSVRLEVAVESGLAAMEGGRCLHQIGYPDDGEEGPIPGGIWQPVTLEELSAAHVGTWTAEWRHATRRLELSIEATGGVAVRVRIGHGSVALSVVLPLRDGRAAARLAIPAALAAWSWRDPVLHPLRLELLDADGAVLDRLDDRLGLREVAIRGRELRWNGEALRLRGLSLIRHRVSPWLWRRDYLRTWFRALRRLGFNSLRLHAAIAPPVVLEVMDEVGLVAINQSSVWSVVVGAYTAGGEDFLANTRREFDDWMLRDRNHPCVVAWDVENEMSAIDPLHARPWVEKLLAHTRGRTRLPVIASASGTLTSSAMVHVHCAQAQHRFLPIPAAIRTPLIFGEWWGPDKAYRDTLRTPNRLIRDPQSPAAHARALAETYRQEISRHRLGGVAGTFPFALEVLLFRPLFAPGEKLRVAARPGEPPLLRSELFHRDRNYHVVRRPLVNPGWSRKHPTMRLEPALAAALRAANAPLLAAFLDLHRDLPGGTEVVRRIGLANDSGARLECRLIVRLIGPGGGALATRRLRMRVEDGVSSIVEAAFRLPVVREPTRLRLELVASAGRLESTDSAELWTWPPADPLESGRLPLGALGADPRLVRHVRRQGLRPQVLETLPTAPMVVLAGRLPPECSLAMVEAFLALGGRLILLRQEADPPAVPLPLRLRSADEETHPVQRGLRRSATQLTWLEESAFTDPDHPALAGLAGGRLRPFAAGDHRLADHAWVRPGVNPPPFVGAHRVLAAGYDRSQAALVEFPGAAGLILACQFRLEENLGIDPQADALLAGLLAHADAWTPPQASWACADAALAQRLATLTGAGAAGDDCRIIADPAEARRTLAALDDPHHPQTRRLRNGGRLLVLARPGLRLAGLEALARPAGDLLCAVAERGREPLGWSSLDLDPLTEREDLAVLRCGGSWREEIRLVPQDPSGQYGSFWVGESCGTVLASRRIGAGQVLVTGLPLATAADRRGDLVWLQALSALGISLPRPPELADDLVTARPSPPLPCDGDLGKWTNTEVDVNLAPWSCAPVIAVDERHLVVLGGDAPATTFRHAALFRVLHDSQHLLVSAQLFAPDFDFAEAETRLYNASSIEVRVGGTWICATRGGDGKLFIGGNGSRDDAAMPNRITGAVHVRPAPASGPDRTMLRLDVAPSQEAFFELRIPLDLLPADLGPQAPPVPFALAFNAALQGPVKRLNCSFPANYQWMDRATWGRLRLG